MFSLTRHAQPGSCNHWTLCRERIEDLAKLLEAEGPVQLNAQTRTLLQAALQMFSQIMHNTSLTSGTIQTTSMTGGSTGSGDSSQASKPAESDKPNSALMTSTSLWAFVACVFVATLVPH